MIDKIGKTPEAVTTAISAIKGFSKYLIVPTGVVVFAPDDWLSHIRLLGIKESSLGVWISAIFWTCLSIIIIDGINHCIKKYKKSNEHKKTMQAREKHFNMLNDGEWQMVYLLHKHGTYTFDCTTASAHALTSMNIIVCGNISARHTLFSYTLELWARTYLMNNADILTAFEVRKKTEIQAKIDSLKSEKGYNKYSDSSEVTQLQEKLALYE